MASIKEEGVKLIDLTFYGTEQHHDTFAGRKGDFEFNKRMIAAAKSANLTVNVSTAIMSDNYMQMEELRSTLETLQVDRFSFFIPHSKGRGRMLQDNRLTKQEFEELPQNIKDDFSKIKYMTEAEWLSTSEYPVPEKRNLTLVLTPDNYPSYANMSASDIIKELEAMDDEYISKMPSIPELAKKYGRPNNQQLYRFRDLLLRWKQEYIKDTGDIIYDMHDETHSFSVHI